ncbi:MAG: thiamine phosphate synthase [Devosiaceae bacterium]|nr:thiamine phosphate synthase [Devosiaceae bacterium]
MQIILTTPTVPDTLTFAKELQSALETGLVPVLLVKKAQHGLSEYKKLIEIATPVAQACDCAVILDNEPQLVGPMKADGVQISSGHSDVLEALNTLKPDYIVGAANINSRHHAMLCGEAGVDYISFGDFTNTPDEEATAFSNWWAELFETPCAVFDPITQISEIKSGGWEFQGLGENAWRAPESVSQALKNLNIRQQKGLR